MHGRQATGAPPLAVGVPQADPIQQASLTLDPAVRCVVFTVQRPTALQITESAVQPRPLAEDPVPLHLRPRIHLMTLCLFLEHGTDPALGTRLHRRMVQRPVFRPLEPPSRRGDLTPLSVPTSGDPSTAKAAAYSWAADSWTVWSTHHATVRTWLTESGRTRSTERNPCPGGRSCCVRCDVGWVQRWIARLAVLYLAVALSTRLADALSMHRCGCAEDCWCQRPGDQHVPMVFPYDHHALDPTENKRLAEA